MSFDKHHETNKDGNRILIVDGHPIVHKGLTYLINKIPNLIVCGEAKDANNALELIKTLKPDMIIIEISLKGLSGIELIERIRLQYPKLPVLVFSMLDELLYARRVFQAGAKGYIMKHETPERIVEAISQVLLKDIFLSKKAAMIDESIDHQSIGFSSLMELLSNRELEVFRLIGQGYGTNRIAEELCMSVKTIEAYRGRIKKKLNIENINKLVHYASLWVQNECQTI